jgi:hypothetical protein
MLVTVTHYAEYLASWAVRAKAAGYFEDVWENDFDVNGWELKRRTRDALETWSGLPRRHATIEEVIHARATK